MIWVDRRVEGGLMTGDTCHGQRDEDVIDMTRLALLLRVGPGEGKLSQAVVESRSPAHGGHRVTLEAVGRESRRRMIGILRFPIVRLVTRNAGDRESPVSASDHARMTIVAGSGQVGAEERKSCLVVTDPHVGDAPGIGRMAVCAFSAQFARVSIGVTR